MRIVIVANGEPPSVDELRAWLRPGDQLACADGGAAVALQHGLKVDIAIGDFDSLTPKHLRMLEAQGAQLARHAREKDETDLELVLLWAARQQPQQIVILGAHGGRSDQFIANLMLLALPPLAGIDVKMIARAERAQLLRPSAPVAIIGAAGDTVSLLPMGGDAHGVRTAGLQYPLVGETLAFGPARGVSNVMLGTRASVSIESGLLLCLHTLRAHHDAPQP